MKKFKIVCLSISFSLLSSLTVFAGQWQQNGSDWSYQNDDGSFMTGWNWVDGNGDNIAESYYMYENGLLAVNTTIEGYTVNENGAWTVEGVVQTKTVETGSSNKQSKYYNENGKPNLESIYDGLIAGDPAAHEAAQDADVGGGYGNANWS